MSGTGASDQKTLKTLEATLAELQESNASLNVITYCLMNQKPAKDPKRR